MDEARKQTRQYLNSLTRDEIIELLEEAGFEVIEGNGKVIFTDTDYKPKPKRTLKL